MPLLKKVKNLWQFPLKLKILIIEAMWYSFLHEIYLIFRIFKAIKPWLCNQEIEIQLSEEDEKTMKMITRSMNIIEKYAPWKPKCYNRAITAKRMLLKRNIDPKIHIGFRKQDNEIKGHAWLSYNGKLVTGFVKGINEYSTINGMDFLDTVN